MNVREEGREGGREGRVEYKEREGLLRLSLLVPLPNITNLTYGHSHIYNH
jgi:hypothetical protein